MSRGYVEDLLIDKKIRIENLTVKYNEVIALEDITVNIDFNDFIAVVGPNGAGKTTLVKTILGLIKPTEGFIKVFGYDPNREGDIIRRIVGYVPQYIHISRHIPMSVLETVLMGILVAKKPPRFPSRKDIKKALESLKIVDMDMLRDIPIQELSGGQRQRVLISRALAHNPKYLVLDEPFTGVDVKSQREIINFLYDYHRDKQMGLLIIVHELAPLINYVDKVLLLNKKMYAYGTPAEVLTKKNIRAAYGVEVEILEHENICYPILGDLPAHGKRR